MLALEKNQGAVSKKIFVTLHFWYSAKHIPLLYFFPALKFLGRHGGFAGGSLWSVLYQHLTLDAQRSLFICQQK